MSGFDWEDWENERTEATALETPAERTEREAERARLLADLQATRWLQKEGERQYALAWVRVLYAHPSVPLNGGPRPGLYGIDDARAEELQDLVEDMVAGYVIEENEAQRKGGAQA